MNIPKNEGGGDRLSRIILSEILFLVGFFWLSSTMQIIIYVLSFVFLVTGIVGFCPLYTVMKINTSSKKNAKISRNIWIVFVLTFLLIATLGSYTSIFFTKKFFLEDYNKMNNYYKQTLFNTGKEMRSESITQYDFLVSEYQLFLEKYHTYHPYSLRGDKQLNADLNTVSSIIISLKEKVYTGNLKEAHLDLEKVRPIFQDILKRNNFSLLAIALVDFHDIMEKVIEAADAKDPKEVTDAYVEADEKLKAVEEVANDSEIQMIRQNLDMIKILAEQDKKEPLPEKAAELKSSFVKVYLTRG
ncbi:MAG: DUF2892 domain-containing protein [Candidatus Gracilibacteria bacterium]|nr:DUF2892 domain-containing protein [Candidatus Gracilibacteria bacterium]